MARFTRLGTIAHGSLRTQDLMSAFLSEAKDRNPEWQEPNTHTGDLSIIQTVDRAVSVVDDVDDEAMTDAFYASEWALDIVNESLPDLLNEDLPPYIVFGTHPGDGSDFGYWFDSESFEQAVSDGEVLKVSDLGDVEFLGYPGIRLKGQAPTDFEYVAVVSDHGNITLYDKNGEEVCGVV